MTQKERLALATVAGIREAEAINACRLAATARHDATIVMLDAHRALQRVGAAIATADPPLTGSQVAEVLGALLAATAPATDACPWPDSPPLPDGTGRVTVEFIIGPISDQ